MFYLVVNFIPFFFDDFTKIMNVFSFPILYTSNIMCFFNDVMVENKILLEALVAIGQILLVYGLSLISIFFSKTLTIIGLLNSIIYIFSPTLVNIVC